MAIAMPYDRTYDNPEPPRDDVDEWQGPAVLEFGTSWCGYCQGAQRDIESARRLGATEVVFFPGYDTDELSLERYFELLELMPRLAEGSFQAAPQRELMPMTP